MPQLSAFFFWQFDKTGIFQCWCKLFLSICNILPFPCLFIYFFLKNLKSAISGLSALSRANHLNIFFQKDSLSVLMHTYCPRQPSSDSNVTRTNGESSFWQMQNVLILIKRPLNAMATWVSVSSWKESRERERPGYKKKSQTGKKETGEKQVYFREVAIMLLGGGVGAINLRLDNGSSKTNFSCLEDSPTKSSVPGWYIALSKATALVLPCTVIFGS